MPVERRQKLRGTTAQLNATQGLLGLLTVDISTMGLRVYDGVTMGGYAIPNKATNDAAYVPQSRLVQGSEGISAGGDLGSDVLLELVGQARTLHDWQETGILFHTGSEGEYRPILLNTGLEINDVDIGGTMTLVMTPDATVVRTSGEQTIAGGLTAFEDDLYVTGAAGTLRALRFSTGNDDRFSIGINNVAEGGANAGSNLQMQAYDDAGAVLGTVLSIDRATRVVTFDQPITGSGLGLTGLVPATRNVSTGDGLSGGGNLSADRTLAVDATVVRTSGNQTIGGTKTFNNAPRLEHNVSLSGIRSDSVVRSMLIMSTDDIVTLGTNDTSAMVRGSRIYFGINSVTQMELTDSGALRNYRPGGLNFLGEPGAANTPTYTFNGLTGRGMYATTDGLGFSTGNVLRCEITGNGFVGAGSGITALNASALASGTVPAGRLNFADFAEAQAATSTTAVMNPLRTLATINAYTVGRAQSINSPTRNVGTAYENTTNSPIVVLITLGLTSQVQMSANGSTGWTDMGLSTGSDSSRRNTVTLIVPPGYFYRVEAGGTVHLWRELR